MVVDWRMSPHAHRTQHGKWYYTGERLQIVESISVAQVGRYLKQSALQPHRSKMWLNTTEKNPDTFEREAATVCQTYLDAPRKAALDGTHTVSVDEATSLQAIERNAPDKSAQRHPGRSDGLWAVSVLQRAADGAA